MPNEQIEAVLHPLIVIHVPLGNFCNQIIAAILSVPLIITGLMYPQEHANHATVIVRDV